MRIVLVLFKGSDDLLKGYRLQESETKLLFAVLIVTIPYIINAPEYDR
ncbi:hypothetical protein AB3U99_10555 [Niallia sp. JL1B1071]